MSYTNSMDTNFPEIYNTDFTTLKEKYWGVKLTKCDWVDFVLFKSAIELKNSGRTLGEISKELCVSRHSIAKWFWCGNLPCSVRLANYNLITPAVGWAWLSINSTRGGLFTGPWINVPNKISNFDDVRKVICQLSSLPETGKFSEILKIKGLIYYKLLLFAYLLGVVLGDASKDKFIRSKRVTRRLSLRLTKFHPSNERFGNFVCFCMKSLGLRMTRGKDMRPGKCNKVPFYAWHSQSSAFLAWIFNVCLGLKDTEVTTYHKIRADWLLNSPHEFKIWFLQGLADSDGFVDRNSLQVGIITEPNTELIKKLFASIDVSTYTTRYINGNLGTVMIGLEDAYSLPIFNPIVRGYRYERLEEIVNAKRMKWHYPEWLNKKMDGLINLGLSNMEIFEKILHDDDIVIRVNRVSRRRINDKW